MIPDLKLTHQDITILVECTQGHRELHEKLRLLADMTDDENHFLIETVVPSFMTRQQRLDELQGLIGDIAFELKPPSEYRKEHHKAIGQAVSIARTLFWK